MQIKNKIVSLLILAMISALFVQPLQARKRKSAIPDEKEMSAYLMVYFKDESHGLYMALSDDGYSFTALNKGLPVMAGDTLAEQKGIRDPHIYRGPDGAFYMAMTDLHIFAQKAGYRTTEWERDGKKYGWGNNRSLVLMKSWDLISWSRSIVRLDKSFPGYDEIGCAWAPETIYDEKAGKMMVYFTMRFGNGLNKIYYSYTDDAFTKMETKPALLWQYPVEGVTAIDGDISKVGDKFHLFYVSHEGVPGIRQAVSDSLTSGYQFDSRECDYEPGASEAPNVWKRIGEDKWVLMYDIYSIQPHNFGFVETTDFVHFEHLGHFNEGAMKTTNFSSPKHGAVIHLTRKEAMKLAKHWGTSMKFN